MNLKRLKTAESGIKPFLYHNVLYNKYIGISRDVENKKEGPVQHGCTGQIMKKNDRKVLVPFDDFTIPEKCEMDMLQI